MQVLGWVLFAAGAVLLFLAGFVGIEGIANLSGVIVGMAMAVCGSIFAAAAYMVEELKGHHCSLKTPPQRKDEDDIPLYRNMR